MTILIFEPNVPRNADQLGDNQLCLSVHSCFYDSSFPSRRNVGGLGEGVAQATLKYGCSDLRSRSASAVIGTRLQICRPGPRVEFMGASKGAEDIGAS